MVKVLSIATSWLQAVTIDDIVCVINSGRHKEKSYDPYTNVSTLQAQWISQASERQRRGRAGRCQQVPLCNTNIDIIRQRVGHNVVPDPADAAVQATSEADGQECLYVPIL